MLFPGIMRCNAIYFLTPKRGVAGRFLSVVIILGLVGVLVSCSEEQDQNPTNNNPTTPTNPNNPNTPGNPVPTPALEISTTSPEFIFWGDELTLTGKGFSSKLEDNFVWLKSETASLGSCPSDNRTDSTGWRKATVLRATDTSLTVKVPYKPASETSNNRACGVINPMVSVTVGGRTAVSERVKLLGIPYISDMCYSNSGFKGAGLIPGKALENQISIPGIGLYGASSGIDEKVKLFVNGVFLPLTKVESTGPTNCASSYKFVIPIEFADGSCDPDPIRTGRFSNMMDFVAVVEGTTKSSEKYSYPVSSFPDLSVRTFTQRFFSYSEAGNPEIVLEGIGLNWYREARFLPQSGGASCTLATIAPVPSGDGTGLTITIPLAQMSVGCTYALSLVDVCGRTSGQVGLVTIRV